jgi:hypothetical protein
MLDGARGGHRVEGHDVERAFDVARFLHADERAATAVIVGALARLEAARGEQQKRAYYQAGREETVRPYKLRLSTPHLLHKLVLEESERVERASEREGDVTDRDLLIRYIKHLVLLSIRHNAFYATLAVTRVLYDYRTRDAMDVYAVIADGEVLKESYDCRARRQRILGLLEERFGARLQFVRACRGERQLLTEEAEAGTASLVANALEMLFPSPAACARCAPQGAHDDDMAALHTIFHPRCFAALMQELRLPSPLSRLRVPLFATPAAPCPQIGASVHA